MYDNKMGKRIKKYRKMHNVTSEQLAENLGISPTFLRSVETGAELPGIDTLCAIADYFNILPRALLSDNDGYITASIPSMAHMSVDDIQIFINIVKAFRKR